MWLIYWSRLIWFFEIGVTHLLSRKYQNRCWIGITETWYTFSTLATMSFPLYFFFQQFKNNFYQFKNTKKYKINLTPIFTIKPTSYLYLSLNSSPSSSKKKKVFFLPNKLLMCLLLMTSPLKLNCLKFNDQSSLSLSLFLTYHLLIWWFLLDFFYDVVI